MNSSNTNPGGKTLITNARETTAEAHGGFEGFETPTSKLVQVSKVESDEQRQAHN